MIIKTNFVKCFQSILLLFSNKFFDFDVMRDFNEVLMNEHSCLLCYLQNRICIIGNFK